MTPEEINKELFLALNEMWWEQMQVCCKLPCTDKECRDDCNEEGGCQGAEFADKLVAALALKGGDAK